VLQKRKLFLIRVIFIITIVKENNLLMNLATPRTVTLLKLNIKKYTKNKRIRFFIDSKSVLWALCYSQNTHQLLFMERTSCLSCGGSHHLVGT
jgi:hypothetical protein